MALSTRTVAEWRDRFRAIIRGLITDADTSRGTDYYATASLLAQLAHATQGQALYVLRQIFPSRADEAVVVDHAREHGLAPLPASRASGLIRIEGTDGSTQPTSSDVTASDGTSYKTTAAVTMVLPAWTGKTVGEGSSKFRLIVLPSTTGMSAGHLFEVELPSGAVARCAIRSVLSSVSAIDIYEPLDEVPAPGETIDAVSGAVAPILADAAGGRGNKTIGETFTIASPVSGVQPIARLVDCGGGADVESGEELRARLTARLRTPPAAGNLEHIRHLARTTPGVRITDAFVYPGVRGLGTIDVVAWGLPGARRPSSPELVAIQAHLDARLHWSDDVEVRAANYSFTTPVAVEIEPHRGYLPDWSGTFETSGTSTTTRVASVTPVVDQIEVGDRLLIPIQQAGRWRLFQRTALAVGSDYVDVDPLPSAPVAGKTIVPGSANSAVIIAAIERYFDDLGPGVYLLVGAQTPVIYHRHPDPGELGPATARRNGIEASCMAVAGVANATVEPLDSPDPDAVPAVQEMVQLGEISISWVVPL